MHIRDIGTCKRKYDSKECNGTLVQVPFVMFCQSGHIEDFPWNEWVHRNHKPICDGKNLKYEDDPINLVD